jgi:hypothetical protein
MQDVTFFLQEKVNAMLKLSQDLLPLYQLELNRGNEVKRVDEPAGTECPYGVIFKEPLHKQEIESELCLVESVKYWESRDWHYEEQAQYYSEKTRHAIAGPINRARPSKSGI